MPVIMNQLMAAAIFFFMLMSFPRNALGMRNLRIALCFYDLHFKK
jgi:hypothetical protein